MTDLFIFGFGFAVLNPRQQRQFDIAAIESASIYFELTLGLFQGQTANPRFVLEKQDKWFVGDFSS